MNGLACLPPVNPASKFFLPHFLLLNLWYTRSRSEIFMTTRWVHTTSKLLSGKGRADQGVQTRSLREQPRNANKRLAFGPLAGRAHPGVALPG
jgi:hypothetical protein